MERTLEDALDELVVEILEFRRVLGEVPLRGIKVQLVCEFRKALKPTWSPLRKELKQRIALKVLLAELDAEVANFNNAWSELKWQAERRP